MTQGNQTTPFNVDELRERLRKMSDAELRTFGQAAQQFLALACLRIRIPLIQNGLAKTIFRSSI